MLHAPAVSSHAAAPAIGAVTTAAAPWTPVGSPAYEPRQPEQTLLYRIVDEHLDELIEHAAESYQRPLPEYVVAGLRAYLKCGRFEEGVLRCRCETCGLDLFVPFSCGSRGLCPSCAARRMCNTAAFLTDRVLPNVPVRQWVLSLPFELRPLCLARPEVVTALGRIFVETTFGEQQQCAGLPQSQTGAVSFLHRAGDSFNANPHWHVMNLDGVFHRQSDGSLEFVETPTPRSGRTGRAAPALTRRSSTASTSMPPSASRPTTTPGASGSLATVRAHRLPSVG